MKHSRPQIRTHKGMIIEKKLATDYTNFHRFKTTKGCFISVKSLDIDYLR